jgi:hypothetical protein
MNDHDVISSKGKESLKRLHASALALLNLTCSRDDLVLFNEENLSLGLKRGAFSPQSDSDLGWVMEYARGEEKADLQGIDVFEFLAELAMVKAQAQRV